MATESAIARNFQKSPLNKDLFTCPGMTRGTKEILYHHNVFTTDNLVGYFLISLIKNKNSTNVLSELTGVCSSI